MTDAKTNARGLCLLLLPLLALSVAVHVAARPRSGEVASRPAPEIRAGTWINSEPLGPEDLRGKVVLVEFWTFGCRNCQNVEPYMQAWHQRYEKEGLAVLAVHTPEFDSEKNVERVRQYVTRKGMTYPVPIDNQRETWRAFANQYWPAMYLIDRQGRIRHVRIGEGGVDETDAAIERLLREPARG